MVMVMVMVIVVVKSSCLLMTHHLGWLWDHQHWAPDSQSPSPKHLASPRWVLGRSLRTRCQIPPSLQQAQPICSDPVLLHHVPKEPIGPEWNNFPLFPQLLRVLVACCVKDPIGMTSMKSSHEPSPKCPSRPPFNLEGVPWRLSAKVFVAKSLLHCKILFPQSSSSTNWFCWIWVPVIDQPNNAHNTPWPLKKCGHAGTLVLRILYNMYVAISMCNVSLDQKLCLHLTCQYITASFPLRYAPASCMRV